VRNLFAPELGHQRGGVFAGVDLLCSFESYELLRYDQGLSRAKATAALIAALTALLDPNGDSR
jgi:hypothetical protein